MPISFAQIPANLRNPQTIAEISNEGAVRGLNVQPYQGLIIGQKVAAGSQTADTIELITDLADAEAKVGIGSEAYLMARAWFANNQFTTLFMGALADNGGTANTQTITITGAATAAGVMYCFINGELVQATVASGDDVTTVAAALVSAINANTALPYTAGNVAGVITLTAKNTGLLGNDYNVQFNYDSVNQSFPDGISATVLNNDDGAGIPGLDNIIAAMADEKYNIITMPYLDGTSYDNFADELDSRNEALRDISGWNVTGKRGSVADLIAFGGGVNSQFFITVGEENTPSSMIEYGAACAAIAAFQGGIDPARPFQTLDIAGLASPRTGQEFTASERETLMNNGVATIKFVVGDPTVNRMITNYQVSNTGADDVSYLDIQTGLTLDYIRYDFRTYWSNKYPRHKLADDGTRFGAGQAIMTPAVAKAECINRFGLWEEVGLVENVDQFKADLVVERNLADRNRLDILMVPDLINQLRVTAVKIQFIL